MTWPVQKKMMIKEKTARTRSFLYVLYAKVSKMRDLNCVGTHNTGSTSTNLMMCYSTTIANQEAQRLLSKSGILCTVLTPVEIVMTEYGGKMDGICIALH